MTSNSNDDTAENIFKNHLSTDLTALPSSSFIATNLTLKPTATAINYYKLLCLSLLSVSVNNGLKYKNEKNLKRFFRP